MFMALKSVPPRLEQSEIERDRPALEQSRKAQTPIPLDVLTTRSFRIGGEDKVSGIHGAEEALRKLAELDGTPNGPEHLKYREQVKHENVELADGALLKPITDRLLKETKSVQEKIEGLVSSLNPDDKDLFFNVKLCLEETLLNHVMHGNRWDPRKSVQVDVSWVTRDGVLTDIVIMSKDEGRGFERKSVPDCGSEDNYELLHGRGTLLIDAYATETRYFDGGRGVIAAHKAGAKKVAAAAEPG